VIPYERYCQIRLLHQERGLNFAQIARELQLDEETVAKWARRSTYAPGRPTRRPSKLDPYKTLLQRWLERHPFTATQLLQRLRAETDYPGGYSILSAYVRTARPARAPAFLTLAFAPGECAQVDWGCAGSLAVGSTRRRLSFFVLVLCYSRLCYTEFTLGEATEHFLAARGTKQRVRNHRAEGLAQRRDRIGLRPLTPVQLASGARRAAKEQRPKSGKKGSRGSHL
jgi:transposase